MKLIATIAFFVLAVALIGCGPLRAATITVTSLADDGGPGELRAAINTANADNDGDTITFDTDPGTISLTSALPPLTANMTIQGPGASSLTVDAAQQEYGFDVAASNATVGISGLTIQNATYSGVYNIGTLTITSCTIDGNSGANYGGGIDNVEGTATIAGCTISDNTAMSGAAIFNSVSSTVTVTNSTISGNTSSGAGGGLTNEGLATLMNCTLSNNVAGSPGGGAIASVNAVILTNCTLTGNQFTGATGDGGGAILNFEAMTLTNCTVSANTSSLGGGAILNFGAGTLFNTILYGDSAVSGDEVYQAEGTLTGTSCDIMGGVGGTTGITNNGGNIESSPKLGALANNGGATETMALENGSPCVGAGTESGSPATDQRDVTRPNPPSIGACDIGTPPTTAIITPLTTLNGSLAPDTPQLLSIGADQAFTAAAAPGFVLSGWTVDGSAAAGSFVLSDGTVITVTGSTLTLSDIQGGHTVGALFALNVNPLIVTTTDDSNSAGPGTLRFAIAYADANPGSTITFQGGLSGTITLASALPAITAGTTIHGNITPSVAIDGAGLYRPFYINTLGPTVSIADLTIQNGSDQQDYEGGGGIFVSSTSSLALTNCTLTGNSDDNVVVDGGGGILNLGTVALSNCTLSSNSSNDGGGGGLASYNSATLTNCTIVANNGGPEAQGGGILTNGTATITDCTFSGNMASDGGGICNTGGTVTLLDTICYADSATTNAEVSNTGSTIASYCDVLGGVGGSTGITDDGNNLSADPLLLSLADNGGPTETMALGDGSPCIGAGTLTGAPATDQQGGPRPNPPSIGAWDSGAAPTTATLTPEATTNGTLSPNVAQSVSFGGSQPFAASANTGYALSGWTVDDAPIAGTTVLSDGTTVTISGSTLTFSNVEGNHTVGATFTAVGSVLLTPLATTNGAISPDTAQTVSLDASQDFTESPSPGYMLTTWTVDGVAVTGTSTLTDGTVVTVSGSMLTFSNVQGSHAVGAGFGPIAYTLSPASTTNGQLAPDTPQTVGYEGTQDFSATPDPGYSLSGWTVDGNEVTEAATLEDGTMVTVSGATLTFSNVLGSHTVGAAFSQIIYTLTPEATTNGNLLPNTAQTVNYDASKQFTANPAIGYSVSEWTVDESPVTGTLTLGDGTVVTVSGDTLTFSNVQGSHSVGAAFAQITCELTPEMTENGTLAPSTTQTVNYDGSTPFTASPSAGWVVDVWTVDGNPVTGTSTLDDGTVVTVAGATLTFSNVQGDHTVGVTFADGYEGDVLNVGTVTLSDWVKVGRFAVGLDPQPTGLQYQKADCAPRTTLGSGKAIDLADWVQTGRYAVSLDPPTPVGGPTAPISQP